MATIAPVITVPAATGVPVVTWTGVSTADTMTAFVVQPSSALAAGVSFSGAAAWGSATVVLKGSLDGSVYFTLKDVAGNSISATADAYFEFTTSCPYLKPASSGGTADNVDVTICMRS